MIPNRAVSVFIEPVGKPLERKGGAVSEAKTEGPG